MKVLFIHAYSPENSGDGLLVDLSRQIAAEALGSHKHAVVALDAAAFPPEVNAQQWSFSSGFAARRLPRTLSVLGAGVFGPSREIRRLFVEADVIVAVGGGYLRARGLLETVKFLGAHLGQLRLAARQGRKTVYLPQSIGPFPRPIAWAVRRLLSRTAAVLVRDDRTRDRLAALPHVRRIPDLAVLEARTMRPGVPTGSRIALVARELPRARSYPDLLVALQRVQHVEVVIQASGLGNDDRKLARLLRPGVEQFLSLDEVLSARAVDVVVSSRLHGSMAAVLAGVPSIHLSYESKGWGAFEDLGLARFVVNARSVSVDTVVALLRELRQDPSAYWASVRGAAEHLRASRAELVEILQRAGVQGASQ